VVAGAERILLRIEEDEHALLLMRQHQQIVGERDRGCDGKAAADEIPERQARPGTSW
jgi:hypothetical protein